MEARWTLDELAERVDAALAVGYHGQPSGRVRDVPDRRAIRWYTTIGLIDRPAAHRGRTALYGQRHLLQLVAVKRLQASGLPLVAIQRQLAGATDTQLARVARLPGAAPPPGRPVPLAAPAGLVPGSTPDQQEDGQGPGERRGLHAAGATAGNRDARGPARRTGFWREPPAAPTAPARDEALATDPLASRAGSGEALAAQPPDPEASAFEAIGVESVRGVRFGDGVTLLLEPGRELEPADLHAIRNAVGPLLGVLQARGLVAGPAGSTPRARSRRGNQAEQREHRREHP